MNKTGHGGTIEVVTREHSSRRTYEPSMGVVLVARNRRIANLLFQSRKLERQGALTAVRSPARP